MSQIEVPDWVVARARAAVREFWENYKGGHDCGEFDAAMKAAIAAALGAWVVPESVQFQDPDGKQWWNFNGPESCRYAESLLWPKRTLYTLRQEKPE